jgi:hypothetical protein
MPVAVASRRCCRQHQQQQQDCETALQLVTFLSASPLCCLQLTLRFLLLRLLRLLLLLLLCC